MIIHSKSKSDELLRDSPDVYLNSAINRIIRQNNLYLFTNTIKIPLCSDKNGSFHVNPKLGRVYKVCSHFIFKLSNLKITDSKFQTNIIESVQMYNVLCTV